MKKFWAAVVIVGVVAGLILLLKSRSPSPETPVPQNGTVAEATSNIPPEPGVPQQNVSPVPSSSAPAPTDLASRAASPNPPPDSTAAPNEPPTLPPLTVLDKARI